MKSKRELLKDLRYHQTMVRVDLRSLKAGIKKCKEIGKALRELQKTKTKTRRQKK